MWPETEANHTASISCEGGMATRRCSTENGGQWLPPDKTQCDPGSNCFLLFITHVVKIVNCLPFLQCFAVLQRSCVYHVIECVIELHIV